MACRCVTCGVWIELDALVADLCLTNQILYGKIGNLSKPRRRRQRERHQTKGVMSKTIAVHVHYKSLICTFLCRPLQSNNVKWPSSPSFSERVFWYFHLELNAVVAYLASAYFRAIGVLNRSRQSRPLLVKYSFIVYLASSSSSLIKLPNSIQYCWITFEFNEIKKSLWWKKLTLK